MKRLCGSETIGRRERKGFGTVNSKELADKAEELGVTGPDGVKWRERALLAEEKIKDAIEVLDYLRIEAHGSEYYYESTFHRDVFEKLTDIIERLKEND
jgi:hypothetical protein